MQTIGLSWAKGKRNVNCACSYDVMAWNHGDEGAAEWEPSNGRVGKDQVAHSRPSITESRPRDREKKIDEPNTFKWTICGRPAFAE